MIKIHHLKQSRSTRIIWLLEELGVGYQMVEYERDPQTRLAPLSMREIHPLGKAPIVEVDGRVLVESAAIIEYLLDRYDTNQLRPGKNSPEYPDYLQWLHFAEGSAMLPVLLDMFLEGVEASGAPIFGYAKKELQLDFAYIDQTLSTASFFAGEEFTAADIMMTTVLVFAASRGLLEGYDNIQSYLKRMQQRDACRKAASFG